MKKLQEKAKALNLKITKDKTSYIIEQNFDSPFVCRKSCYSVKEIEKQINFFAVNNRFTTTKVIRDLRNGAILERF